MGVAALPALPPLALYIHFPWCVRKCPYCDFNSHAAGEGIPEQRYISALIADLEGALPALWGRPIHSVFLGGGTPSLFSPESIDTLLGAVRARLTFLPDAEITLEANPGASDAHRFAGYRAAGVTRLSVGVQSFQRAALRALGRIHDDREARAAVDLALEHFAHVNLDLMYALPQQTLDAARADFTLAASLAPQHLSAYHLTLEPGTAFHRLPPPLPDDDLAARMQETVEALLAAQGYEHYETSAFARPGERCRHNLNYWQFGDYLGIGAGAHGKLTRPAGEAVIVREVRKRQPQAYMAGVERGRPLAERHVVPNRDLPFEFMINALRLREGVPAELYAERTGLPLETLRTMLDEARSRDLLNPLAEAAGRIAPSPRGRRFLNDLLQIFLPA